MTDAGVELNAETIEIAIKVGRSKHEGLARQRRTRPERIEIVYYIKRAELVKIGTTRNPAHRLHTLMPDEILAFEPGGPDLEARRHKQFHPERVWRRGEYFRSSPRLQKHIAELRDLHGDPDDSWPSIATMGRGYRRGREDVVLPAPASGELLTSAEAAKRFTMSVSTISQWVRRGRIVAAGTNEKGRPVYHLEHVEFLISRGRESQNWRPR
ncbi:GIY-YIG nuclease family protein [Streptomyces sp. NBC_01353]|uniref:GIY-YIG nuclease family protein n=1 Tax=Streptomyces sp. NBC_01353 TaxID=2903835 RepID=UPI002E34C9D8|nr:GIY-YIG nuclease family protein [Streptomyces sp. NBC_01353]